MEPLLLTRPSPTHKTISYSSTALKKIIRTLRRVLKPYNVSASSVEKLSRGIKSDSTVTPDGEWTERKAKSRSRWLQAFCEADAMALTRADLANRG